MYKDGKYVACNATNVTVNAGTPLITYKGNSWWAYIPLRSTNDGNLVDNDFSTKVTIATNAGNGYDDSAVVAIPKVPKLGELTNIYCLVSYGATGGTSPTLTDYWRLEYLAPGTNVDLGDPGANASEQVDIGTFWGSTAKSAWDFEGKLTLHLNNSDTGSGETIDVQEVGLEIEFTPDNVFTKNVPDFYTRTLNSRPDDGYGRDDDNVPETVVIQRTKAVTTPANIDYVYFAGEGRKYFSAIDSGGRSNGYASDGMDDPIENPVYIIEEIIRTELSRTEIDTDTFDNSGNATNGYIGDAFNDAVTDIKFALSQYKFINSKDFIDKICKQCFSWVFISGDGNFKIATLRRPGDYASANKTIDFNDIELISVGQTPMNAVRNDVSIKYNLDYGQDQTLSKATASDSTSQGTTSSGYNQTLKFEMEATGIIDSTTASQLADGYVTLFKDRKNTLQIKTLRPLYNDLEIGDIAKFSNWDSNIKIYGSTMGTDYFIIQDITKYVDSARIKLIQVS
jgi:hypothetical protein